MNKQQLFTAGSVLLATTALSSAANAGTVTAAITGSQNISTVNAWTATNIANTVFSTTAATANAVTVGLTSVYVQFANNFTAATKFSVELDPIGAGLIQAVDARLLLSNSGSFLGVGFTVAATTACTSVTPLTTKIILDGCGGLGNKINQSNGANNNVSASYGGVLFSGVGFNNASGLASVGAAIGVNGLVYNANNTSQTFENITAANVAVSAAPVAVTIGSGGTATASASATPVAFAYFSTGSGAIGITSVQLAYVDITGTAVYAADLTSIAQADTATTNIQTISSIQVTVTSTELSQAAVQSVSVNSAPAIYNGTVSNFSAGVATFSINNQAGFTSFVIQVDFSGTTALSAASAGTVTVAFGIGNGMGQAVPTVTGKTGTISLGGFNAELNTFLTSANTSFSSFARIHNNGILAAVATVTVRNDATGASMGVYTTASIATNQTLQISAKDIESGAGITAAAGVNYTLSIAGAFSGYAQHIIFNPVTGQLADLSSFRNRGGAGSVTTP